MKYNASRPYTKIAEYNPDTRLTLRTAKSLDEIKAMLHADNFARVSYADKNRLRASANRYGYKWSWVKDGRYYIVKVVVK